MRTQPRKGRRPAAIASKFGGIIAAAIFWQLYSPMMVRALDVPPPTNGPRPECAVCHTCPLPTPATPCLRLCERPSATQAPGIAAPNVVLLDELEDRFLPVPFDHRGHADMAGMTRGCVLCHHFTPEGAAHPACKTCHEAASNRADIHKPGLKGAYHRQCLNCHREWSDDTKCELCHRAKTGREDRSSLGSPTPDDIAGRMHPPIPEPDTETFRPRNGSQAGSQVVFYHKEHIHRFGLACVECHHEDNCSRCHQAERVRDAQPRPLIAHHQPCAQCHETTKPEGCSRCHTEANQPKPPRFDHASTGFPLKSYHERAGCRACHRTVPFSPLPPDCATCHRAWEPTSFKHEVTGQTLDANHVALDCSACHTEGRFDRPPACDACHEPAEGVAFPSKTPGPRSDLPRRP